MDKIVSDAVAERFAPILSEPAQLERVRLRAIVEADIDAIFSIYSLSFMSLGVVALTLFGRLGIPSAIVSLLAIFGPPVHMYRQLKGTYRLGRFGAFSRTVALLVITSITSSLFITFLFYMGSE